MTKRNALLAGTDRAPLGSAVFWKSRFARYFESFRLALATTAPGPRAVIYAARLYRLRKSRACALAATRGRGVSPTGVLGAPGEAARRHVQHCRASRRLL